MSTETSETVVVGDSLITMRFPVEDAEGLAVDLTGGTARIFPNGVETNDKPTDVAGGNPTRTGVTLVAGNTTFTVSSGTGLAEGMRVTTGTTDAENAFAPGTEVTGVAGTTVTVNRPILTSVTPVVVTFWHGLNCDMSEAANAIVKIQGLPAALRPGNLTEETYRFDIRYKDASGKVGFSLPDEFNAVTPVI